MDEAGKLRDVWKGFGAVIPRFVATNEDYEPGHQPFKVESLETML